MDRRALVIAGVLGGPPGIGMGLALLSITRGEAVLESMILGTAATAFLITSIYVIATRGSVEEVDSLGET